MSLAIEACALCGRWIAAADCGLLETPATERPPANPVIFVGEPGRLPELEIVLLAFAAPVLALSIIFLKKPLFFAFGVERPPSTPALSEMAPS
jgi:hypothetical protein